MKCRVEIVVPLLLALPACIECDCSNPTVGFCHNLCFGPTETGGYDGDDVDHGHLACTFDGKCILDLDADDPIVQQAIIEGMFKPYTFEGSCPKPLRTWQTLGWWFPTIPPYSSDDDAYFRHAGYCPNQDFTIDYSGPTPSEPAVNFPLCWPGADQWIELWEQGAVARPGPGGSDCASLPSYGGAFSWPYQLDCPAGVYCLGLDEDCVCRCPTGADTPCTHVETVLETSLNAEMGELICEGYPFRSVSGEFVPTGCVWNTGSGLPARSGRPWHRLNVSRAITCSGDRTTRITCHVAADLRETLQRDAFEVLRLGVRWSLTGPTLELHEVDPAGVAGHCGLQTGDWILGVDEDLVANAVAFAKGAGDLTLEIVDDRGDPFTLTLTPM